MHAPGAPEEVAAARALLLRGFRILDRHGLGARIAGHLTLRHPARDAFWTHRFGLAYDEVGPDDLVLADLDLRVLEGAGPVNPTLHIHAQIYRARPEVRSVVHTHGTNIVALSATDAEFAACSQMAGIFVDDIAGFDEQDLIVLDAGAGATMAAALGHRSALLLRNHGSLVVGASLPEAVLKTLVLEEAAEVQLKAMATGRMRPMGRAAAEQVRRFVLSPGIVAAYWNHEVRHLGAGPPARGEEESAWRTPTTG